MQALILRCIQCAVLFLIVMYQHGSVVSQGGLLYVFPQGTLLSKDLHGCVVSCRASMLICIAMTFCSRNEFLSKSPQMSNASISPIKHPYSVQVARSWKLHLQTSYFYKFTFSSHCDVQRQLTASCGNRLHSIAGT